ncbi:hypothetical protein [Actinomyces sp. MRS3W]|uniref:hypothetical protein n=1 Tax=Actinomyces sp. MRS3W TaxID=2800796 RepID=UPI0028FD682D|nr:hypothetical protein [Actinomyces sp. MRS3W]MDU0347959.1 hypothetical protein [Actinomyces sp. MRS3W]
MRPSPTADNDVSAPTTGLVAAPGLRTRRLRAAALAVVLTVVLVLPTLTGCGDSLPAPGHTPTATAVSSTVPSGVPADIPDTLAEEIRWQRVIDEDNAEVYHVNGVMAGASGPIVVTAHGALGLDPDTGETTWSFRDPELTGSITGYGAVSSERARGRAVLSPDGTRLVIGLGAGTFGTRLVALDTATGEVLFEHLVTGYAIVSERSVDLHIQVTDHVVMAEREVVSLEDGSLVATLPEDPAVVDGDRTCVRTDLDYCSSYWPGSQGGHSTLILDSTCWAPGDTDTSWCELTLAPDTDPTASRQVGGFVPIDRTTGDAEGQSNVAGENLDDVFPVLTPPIIDGWTVRYSDSDAAYTALSTNGADPLALPLEAVSLDALVDADDAAPVPLGASGRTVRDYGARTLAIVGADPSSAGVIFDPATRQVQDADEAVEQAVGPGYLDALAVTRSGADLDVTGPDGNVVLHLTSDDAGVEVSDAYLVQAPGVIVAVDHHRRTTAQGGKADETVIFGIG